VSDYEHGHKIDIDDAEHGGEQQTADIPHRGTGSAFAGVASTLGWSMTSRRRLLPKTALWFWIKSTRNGPVLP
jgi:hypothetical protein